jgi:hypothetical protein
MERMTMLEPPPRLIAAAAIRVARAAGWAQVATPDLTVIVFRRAGRVQDVTVPVCDGKVPLADVLRLIREGSDGKDRMVLG